MQTKPKGPGLFLAQFSGRPGFENLENSCKTAAANGYTCIQIPSWDSKLFNLGCAAESKDYCDHLVGKIMEWGLKDGVTEIATHLQGQLMAVHPAYLQLFRKFGPPELQTTNDPKALYKWAEEQMLLAVKASKNLGLNAIPSFTGSFLWPYIYPWPQLSQEFVGTAFKILGKRWEPVFDAASDADQSIAFELHPGEDVHDGDTFARFLETVGGHEAAGINFDPSHFVLMNLDYVGFIETWADRIKAYHVKDAETASTANQGFYGAFQPWGKRNTRFRSLGDGQVQFADIEEALEEKGLIGIPRVLEWECAIKGPEQGLREGAPFIRALINAEPLPEIVPATKSNAVFDDFVKTELDHGQVASMLGVSLDEIRSAA
ncbi:MAG: endonuclease [Candidatus Taylorbacteria bacterium]|nr:endonuclease [Candidatus Taylorbacteria bacterium]